MVGFIAITIVNLGFLILNKPRRWEEWPHRHFLDLSPVEDGEDNYQQSLEREGREGKGISRVPCGGPGDYDDAAGFPNAGRTTTHEVDGGLFPFLTK